MFIALGILLVCAGTVLIWFGIPYSPLRQQFLRDASARKMNSMPQTGEVFTESDFENLPGTIWKYINHCGYIGKHKMTYMRMDFKNVSFMMERKGPAVRIDYIQYNFAKYPARLALTSSSLYGIPFNGYDYYLDGKGGMKVVIGKAILLAHQTGDEMNKACLVSYLGDCLFIPASIAKNNITFAEISEREIKATIVNPDLAGLTISVSGILSFNESGERNYVPNTSSSNLELR